MKLMPHYMIQGAYSPEALAALSKNPQNRAQAIAPAIEAAGGHIEAAYFSFGEYDIVCIVEMPDNASAAAFAIAGGSSGAVKAMKTTPLLTIEEGLAAMQKSGSIGYQPPG
jgi:uncharacterized protein with GYD domain